jgi:hypothetical protein
MCSSASSRRRSMARLRSCTSDPSGLTDWIVGSYTLQATCTHCPAEAHDASVPLRWLSRRRGRSCRMLGRDPSGVGVRIRNGPAGLTQMREMRRERFRHPRLDLLARPSQREHTVHVRTMGAPGTVFSLLIDDEVVLQRRSRSPVARRIAASVPTGTVSESLPAIVTIRAPSALSQVS